MNSLLKIALLTGAATVSLSAAADDVAITNAMVFDGTGAAPILPAW